MQGARKPTDGAEKEKGACTTAKASARKINIRRLMEVAKTRVEGHQNRCSQQEQARKEQVKISQNEEVNRSEIMTVASQSGDKAK